MRSSNQGFSGCVDAFGRIDRQLPAHDEFIQRDFVSPNAIPKSIRLPNATHATRLGAEDGSYMGYRQGQLDNDEVEDPGFGIDLVKGDDYEIEFPTDEATFLTVPLELGSSYHYSEIIDEPGDDQRIESESQIDFDGFGTLHTPDGDRPALHRDHNADLLEAQRPTHRDQSGWLNYQRRLLACGHLFRPRRIDGKSHPLRH